MIWLSLAIIALLSVYACFITLVWFTQQKNISKYSPSLKQQNIEYDEQQLNAKIQEKADEAQALLQTFQKFVPKQFVDHFNNRGEKNLHLGIATEDKVAVMFCDIHGFTSLAEQMSPQQLMNFLNSYFLRMNAPIHENHGFIDKFIGDAIMALFNLSERGSSNQACDALNASIDLHKALMLYNQHRANSDYDAIAHGIGIQYGSVVMGTVGSDDRMDTTVLGDVVNVAQRIESLCEYFQTDILTTRDLINVAEQKQSFAHRYIDTIILRGKSVGVELIEVYEHLSSDQIALRDQTKSFIDQGIELRNTGEFKQAIDLFEQALQINPKDSILRYHIKQVENVRNIENWNGNIYIN